MGTTRRLFTDEFKREAVELLASSGRPLSQIAGELGIAASMLRAWRNKGDGGQAGSPRRPNTQAAIPPAGADGGRKRPPAARERTLAHGTGIKKRAHRSGETPRRQREAPARGRARVPRGSGEPAESRVRGNAPRPRRRERHSGDEGAPEHAARARGRRRAVAARTPAPRPGTNARRRGAPQTAHDGRHRPTETRERPTGAATHHGTEEGGHGRPTHANVAASVTQRAERHAATGQGKPPGTTTWEQSRRDRRHEQPGDTERKGSWDNAPMEALGTENRTRGPRGK